HPVDPPRDAARRAGDRPADPRARRVRAPGPRDGGDHEPDPTPWIRAAPLLRDAHLPPGPHARRLRALLLHVLDLPRAPESLPGGPVRAPRGARTGRGPRAPRRAGARREAARLRADGMGGSRLEHALDQVLSEARREAPPAVDPDATDRRAAQPAGASSGGDHEGALSRRFPSVASLSAGSLGSS